VGQFEFANGLTNPVPVLLCEHGKKESKEKALQKEESTET
jgi:hypothetical protein